MAELADALDSGSNRGNSVEVQVLLSAPDKKDPNRFSKENGSDFLFLAACSAAQQKHPQRMAGLFQLRHSALRMLIFQAAPPLPKGEVTLRPGFGFRKTLSKGRYELPLRGSWHCEAMTERVCFVTPPAADRHSGSCRPGRSCRGQSGRPASGPSGRAPRTTAPPWRCPGLQRP